MLYSPNSPTETPAPNSQKKPGAQQLPQNDPTQLPFLGLWFIVSFKAFYFSIKIGDIFQVLPLAINLILTLGFEFGLKRTDSARVL
jgi:hypothetical protein